MLAVILPAAPVLCHLGARGSLGERTGLPEKIFSSLALKPPSGAWTSGRYWSATPVAQARDVETWKRGSAVHCWTCRSPAGPAEERGSEIIYALQRWICRCPAGPSEDCRSGTIDPQR